MDPLSITASIIGVIQLTSAVISAAYNYRNGVKNAPEDAVRIIDDLTGLSQILEKLLKLIEKDRSTGSAQLRAVSSPFLPVSSDALSGFPRDVSITAHGFIVDPTPENPSQPL
jgi:hypothetical protein